jgi:tape measure domain-containing protein
MAADLEFRIGAELTEIKGALAQLRREFAQVGQAASQAAGGKPLANLEKGVTSAVGQLKGLIAGFVSLAAVMKAIQTADELATLNARLRLVTSSTEEFAAAQVKLFELAQRSRTELGETIRLYAQIASATKDAGVGQETLLQVVETINQAVQLSGASTQAAEAALVQLGQGLASGTLRGEELNSVLEQTPALADAIAKGMGITRDKLRKYGEEGKITAEQVIKALQKQRDEVAKQFQSLPLTVGQAVTQLGNAGKLLVSVFSESSGATAGLASVISDLAAFLSSDEVIGSITTFAAAWGNAFADIVRDTQEAVQIIKDATADIAGDGRDLVQIVGDAFTELPRNLRSAVRIVATIIAGIVDSIIADAVLAKEAIAAIFTDDTIEAAVERRNRRVNASLQTVKESIEDEVNANRKAVAEAKAVGDAAVAARKKARASTGSTGTGNFRPQQSDAQKREAEAIRKATLDAEEKLEQDSAARKLRILDELYEDATLATAAYYARRQELELAALDRSIAIEQQRTAAGGAEAIKAKTQIEILQRQRADIEEKGRRERLKAEREIEDQLGQLRAQDLENQGQTAEAAKIRLEAQFRDLRKRLEADGNAAGLALVDKLINTEAARAKFAELDEQAQRILSRLRSRTQEITNQQQTGALPAGTAQDQQAAARTQALTDLTALNVQMQALAENTNDPRIIEGAQNIGLALQQMAIDGATGIDKALINLRSSLQQINDDFANAATGAGVDALTGFFTDLVEGTKGAGEALRDFVRGFALSMAQIAARALATFIVLQTLDAIYPGLGKIVSATMSAGVQHSGGMAGSGPRRNVSPLMFAGAPRYHDGGMVGLKPDEVPAILQTGEEVLSRDDPRNAANGGGMASGGGTRIINVVDPNLVEDYMNSPSGERVVLNVIERNAGNVRQKLES